MPKVVHGCSVPIMFQITPATTAAKLSVKGLPGIISNNKGLIPVWGKVLKVIKTKSRLIIFY